MITILHLSDIHLGTKEEAEKYRIQLETDLKTNLKIEKLHYLVISGDIANYSTRDEYDAAFQLIDKIRNRFGLDSDRIVVVPGNHDLNWDLSEKAYDYVAPHKMPDPLTEEYIPGAKRDRRKYKKRFDNFSIHFYKKLFEKRYPLEYSQQGILYQNDEDRIVFLALNSSWNIDHYYKGRARINMDALGSALDKLLEGDYNDWLKIAVWHHPVTGPEPMNDEFMELLTIHKFQVCMHGHIHEAREGFYRYDNNRGIHIIGAGTFGAPAHEQVAGIPLQYNLLLFDPDSNNITIKTRKKEKPDGAWSADARWGDKEKPKPEYDIELSPQLKLSVISSSRLKELREILSKVILSDDELTAAYRESLPPVFKALSRNETLDSIVNHLCDIPRQDDNTLPLLVFTQVIVKKINNKQIAEQLRQWIEQVASETECALGEKKTDYSENDAALIVKLISDNNHDRRDKFFNVQIYLRNHSGDVEHKDTSEKTCSVNQIQQRVDEFLAYKIDPFIDIKTIEFLLPSRSVFLEVDQWQIKENLDRPKILGKTYELIIRLDRAIHNAIVKIWNEKWQCLKRQLKTFLNDSVVWVCEEEHYEPGELCDRLAYSDNSVCLIMTFIPVQGAAIQGPGSVILEAGIPVALCCRKKWDSKESSKKVESEIRKMISGKSFIKLPEVILKKRRHVTHDKALGNHLTLLWDSPDKRTIPKEPLKPTMTKG